MLWVLTRTDKEACFVFFECQTHAYSEGLSGGVLDLRARGHLEALYCVLQQDILFSAYYWCTSDKCLTMTEKLLTGA